MWNHSVCSTRIYPFFLQSRLGWIIYFLNISNNHCHTCSTHVALVLIFFKKKMAMKEVVAVVGEYAVKWKLLGTETAIVKGFFSKIIILDNKWLLKIAKKMRKCIFLFNGPELERVLVFRPPLFFDFRGGHTSSILSNSCSFLRYAFLGLKFIFQNNDFWEKSFYYSSFYA